MNLYHVNAQSETTNNITFTEKGIEYIKNLEIPVSVVVDPKSLDEGNLILTAINVNNVSIEYVKDLDQELTPFQLDKWYQPLQFLLDSDTYGKQNLTINNLLIGPINSFDTFDGLLSEGSLYKNIKFGNNITITLPNKGVSFMMAEIQFPNNTSAIFYGLFDGNQVTDSPDVENGQLSENLPVNLQTSLPLDINDNKGLYDMSYTIICNDLSKFNYFECP